MYLVVLLYIIFFLVYVCALWGRRVFSSFIIQFIFNGVYAPYGGDVYFVVLLSNILFMVYVPCVSRTHIPDLHMLALVCDCLGGVFIRTQNAFFLVGVHHYFMAGRSVSSSGMIWSLSYYHHAPMTLSNSGMIWSLSLKRRQACCEHVWRNTNAWQHRANRRTRSSSGCDATPTHRQHSKQNASCKH